MDKVIKRLKDSTSDSEKFAYLLIVTKLPHVAITEDIQEALCSSIGTSFITRLVQSTSTGSNSILFKKLGVSILSSFFLTDKYSGFILKLIPSLLEVSNICYSAYNNLWNF